ncbi:hypothetical protein J0X14_12445 [Muricauda sp. CAU 1633]|uniref:hypothetical protein n=1 Tax=Allomuricauda sp. CAU 1633 TaxID=2816036 RepID=UPI001A8FC59F|nr:hypothetical protein [Muricauda sp. CAU 1633]MBO0323109.1 hypothetical protein [Muricauda sp. CAU 1633]
MRRYPKKNIAILFLLQVFLSCSLHNNKKNNQNEGLTNGKALVDHLDSLFDALQSKKATDTNFQEAVVNINENIRQSIEHNVTNPDFLKEIQTYFPRKKHDFSFLLSEDEKFGVISWSTRKKEFPIKNIAFYESGDGFAPTSLYGNPTLYDQLDMIHDGSSGMPIYILGGLKDTTATTHQYHLSAYIIRKDGIEESYIFPNGESSITVHCPENKPEACLAIENKALYAAIAQ